MTEAMVVEAVRAATANSQVAGTAVPAAPDPAAVERFMSAMSPEKVDEIPFAAQIAATWKNAEGNYQGILHRVKALAEIRERHYPSAAELSELQYEIANLTFQQEVATNIAKKSSDAVSTLIKNG